MTQPEILYQDESLLAVNKPAGLLVHGDSPNLAEWLDKKFPEVKNVGDLPAGRQGTQERPGIVHRLDKDTSGVLIVARNQKTFEYLKNLFQTHQIKKTYLALVWGRVTPKSGLIEKPLGLKSGTTKRTVHVQNAKMVKEAKTLYRVKTYFENYTLLEVEPLTGRTHQIRVHLASIGHPIVGDNLYGKKPAPAGLSRMFLHAESLELTLPTGSRLRISADLPPELNLEQFGPADSR